MKAGEREGWREHRNECKKGGQREGVYKQKKTTKKTKGTKRVKMGGWKCTGDAHKKC